MLFKTRDCEGLRACMTDGFRDILVGIDSENNIVGIVNDQLVFSVPGTSIEDCQKTIYRGVVAIVSTGGVGAAKRIGRWSLDQQEDFLEHALNLHYVYCMPAESHVFGMMQKNSFLIKLMKELDLSVEKSYALPDLNLPTTSPVT